MTTSSTTLRFSEDYSDVVLLDVSDEEIRNAVTESETEGGAALFFKGGAEDAVLCTKKSTFALFSRETSNELLLVNGDRVTACGAHRVIEPCRVLPRLDQLKRILMESAIEDFHEMSNLSFTPDENLDNEEQPEDDESRRKRTRKSQARPLEDLLAKVQASEQELLHGLKALGAVEIEAGKGWYILSREQEEKVVRQFVEQLKAEPIDVTIDELEEADVVNWLDEYPSCAARSIYQKFFNNKRLNLKSFAEFQSETILAKNRDIGINRFADVLAECLPWDLAKDDVTDIVKRVALLSEDRSRLTYFPADALPKDPRKRCEMLFTTRSFWLPKDLEAFLEGVDGGVTDAVQKYARSSTNLKGERGYIKR